MRKIIVLGSKGMLGQMVKSYFEFHDYDVHTYDIRFSETNYVDYFKNLNEFEESIVFNCIGRIKQKSDDSFNLLWSNSIFPLALTKSLKKSHLLIHASTDCVFDGYSVGFYDKDHIHDAEDMYGWSKSLGEFGVLARNNSIIIRVSIIGLDEFSNKGLLSWFLNNPEGEKLKGFKNHYWNGITTLEWCKITHKLIKNLSNTKKYDKIYQIGTDVTYSKYEMLLLFQEVFNTNFIIEPIDNEVTINRCLYPEILAKDLRSQLLELKEFWKK